MRYVFLLMILAVVAIPAFAERNKDKMSPELKQCIESCKKEKDLTANEGCLIKCSQDDTARRRQQKTDVPDKK